MPKSRRETFHSWAHKDVFPANLKKLSFGDTFGLFLGFLYDWSGRGSKKDHELLPRNAVDLSQHLSESDTLIEYESEESKDLAASILETWIYETQAKYPGDEKSAPQDGFLSLKPVHLNMARIWPSQYSSDSRVGLQRLYFSLLAYNESRKVDTEILESVREFFNENHPSKIGAFSSMILSASGLNQFAEADIEDIRKKNIEKMTTEIPPPFCLPHALMFRTDIQSLMKYRRSLSHVELMTWLYACICYHLGTYTLRTASALRAMMENLFESIEADSFDDVEVPFIKSCAECTDLADCPYDLEIPVSATDNPPSIDINEEPFTSAVIIHRGIILEHPAYLSTLARLRETSHLSASLNEMALPSDFLKIYYASKRFRSRANKLLVEKVKEYLNHVSEVISPAIADDMMASLTERPSSALRIFKDAVRNYYAEVGSRYDSTAAVWSFYKGVAGEHGAHYLMTSSKERPEFYFLSMDFLTVMAHILLATNQSASISGFLRFLEKRGIILDSSGAYDQIAGLTNTLQEMGMYVKTSDDVSAQFLYPLYPLRSDAV
ncbi:MAG: hypothetical protein ACFFER_03360 [Candidatus Thorarchaeota archaeon]